eukprot:scaffold3036_cov117-Cylindrotheca_fusiformis.AAC.14
MALVKKGKQHTLLGPPNRLVEGPRRWFLAFYQGAEGQKRNSFSHTGTIGSCEIGLLVRALHKLALMFTPV